MAYRSSSNLAYGSTSSPALPVPSGVAAGDGVVLSLYVESTSVTVNAVPSGFTLAGSAQTSSSSTWITRMYVKQATGADAGSYTFTLSGSAACQGTCGAFTSRTGALDGTAQQGTVNGVTQPANLTLVTSSAGSDLVYTVYDFSNSLASGVTPGFTLRVGSADGHALYTVDNVAAGSTSARQNALSSDQWTYHLLGLTLTSAAAALPNLTMAPIAGY